MAAFSTRSGICMLEMQQCRAAATMQPILTNSTVLSAPPAAGLASSPRGSAASDNTMLTRMRAVLKRHQCGTEEEAVSTCLRAQTSQQSVMAAGAPCSGYINSLRYCQLQTQQHNYPVAPAFLY